MTWSSSVPSDVPWHSYRSVITSVEIGDEVTSLCKYIFSECDQLRSVSIPASVTVVGYQGFYGCDSLATVALPDSLQAIYVCAFADCGQLSKINIGSGLNVIGQNAFLNCDSLSTVLFNGDVQMWSAIQTYSGNDALRNANIICLSDLLPGDVDNDGSVNSRDVIAILQAIASRDTSGFTDTQEIVSDANHDNHISVRDAIIILEAIAGNTSDQL